MLRQVPPEFLPQEQLERQEPLSQEQPEWLEQQAFQPQGPLELPRASLALLPQA